MYTKRTKEQRPVTNLTAAQLKDLAETLLFTRCDTGVGTVELTYWVTQARKVHTEVSATIALGTSKRNTALMAKVVESLERLTQAIERIEGGIEKAEALKEVEAAIERVESNVIKADFAPKQPTKKEMTLWHRNAQSKRPEAIQCREVTQQDWGFSFFVDGELEAYKAFYQYRNSKHGAIVEFAGGANQWMVTVLIENGAELGREGV